MRPLLRQPHHDGSDLYVVERPDELGDEATVLVRTPADAADRVFLRYLRDGEPRVVPAERDREADGETWWRASFPLSNPSTRYRFLLHGGTTGYGWLNGQGVSRHEPPGNDDYVLALGSAPAWHASSVVYEIFPDRFASSGAERAAPAWVVRRGWDEPPTGRGPETPYEWYGGDLRGIEEHLDHVEALGANVVYLTPVFPAGSTHRYDAATFHEIDPLLGGDDAFRSLADALHRRGMRLVGDLTPNHTGDRHAWFEAARSPHTPERDFYYFDEALPDGYASWLGVSTLPKLDWRNEQLKARIREVVGHWIDRGLDGWRIDVANMIGRYGDIDLNHEAARWLRGSVNGSLLVAEHGHDFRGDLDGSGWHGVMNYAGFLKPAWWWLRADGFDEDVFSSAPAPRYDGADLAAVMRRYRTGLPWQAVENSWLLLDSHDTARFAHVVGGDRGRQLVGVGLMMTTPGVPMVFAGDELGLTGAWGEDARRTMPWSAPERWDGTLLDAYRALARLRRDSDALARGSLRYVHVADDAVAYLRETAGERLLCLAARAAHEPIATPFERLETLYGGDARGGVLPADGPAFHVWKVS
jgi:alpha-glucosidase